MEPQTPTTEPTPVPPITQPDAAAAATEVATHPPMPVKKASRLKDALTVLVVIVVAAGIGWWLANRGTTPADDTTAVATPTPTASADTSDFTDIDTALSKIETDLDTADTSADAATKAPADSDTVPAS